MTHPATALQAFTYHARPFRVIERDGEPWFVLKDVCAVLNIQNRKDVADRLDDDEKGVTLMNTLGGKQEMAVVNESGLYAVILRSDKPEAKPFRKWVTSEVLPSLRKHGFYETPGNLRAKRSQARPKLEKHVYTSIKCRICLSTHAHSLDQMLTGNVLKQDGERFTYDEIVLWARMQGLKLSKAGLSRHRTDHLLPRLNAEASSGKRGGLDELLRRAVREVVEEVLGGVLKDVQSQVQRAQHDVSPAYPIVQAPAPQARVQPSRATAITLDAVQPLEPTEVIRTAVRGKSKVKEGPRKRIIRRLPINEIEARLLEKPLLDILFIKPGLRAFQVEKLAEKYDVDPSTVREWVRKYEKDGLEGIITKGRKDRGHFRLPEETVQALVTLIHRYPDLGSRQLQRKLVEAHPELSRWTGGARDGQFISRGTIERLKRAWLSKREAEIAETPSE